MCKNAIHIVIVVIVVLFIGGCAETQRPARQPLTIGDVNSTLKVVEGTPLDAVKNQNISYAVTGLPAYDEFFKKATITHGGFEVAKTMTEEANATLKKFARSHFSGKEVGSNMELLKDANLESLSIQQAMVVLQACRAELSDAETEYLAKTAHNLGTAGVTMDASIATAPKLLAQANQLLDSAKTDFSIWQSPGIMSELQDIAGKLKHVLSDGPAIAKNILVLADGLTMFAKA